MEKLDISKLEKNRGIFFKLGLVLSIGLAILGLNWTTILVEEVDPIYQAVESEIEIPIVPFPDYKKKVLPPPVVKATETKNDTPEFIEEIELDLSPIEKDPKQVLTHKKITAPFVNKKSERKKPAKIVKPVIVQKVTEIVTYEVSEIMPRFAGCEDLEMTREEKNKCAEKELLRYMAKHIKYPSMAKEVGITGTVVVSFIVDEHGNISDLKMLKEIGGGCGSEAMRVIKGMPKWIPGQQGGKNVRVRFKLPIRFKLK